MTVLLLSQLAIDLLGSDFNKLTVGIEHLERGLDRTELVGQNFGRSSVPRLLQIGERAFHLFRRKRLSLVQE